MSLKITVEVDGQTEQQLTPVIGQLVARHPEWLVTQKPAPEQPHSRDFYHDNSALLQQHIQQLTEQNKLLQAQVSYSQRLLEGVPQAKALLPRAAERAITAPAVSASPNEKEPSAPPPLPTQYQSGSGDILYRIRRSLVEMPARLWQALVWLAFGKEWLLLFLLLCGGTYGALTVAPKLAHRLWPQPEFVDSAGVGSAESGPGDIATPEPENSNQQEKAPPASKPTASPSPTSKAGSHPPPPPAFEQP